LKKYVLYLKNLKFESYFEERSEMESIIFEFLQNDKKFPQYFALLIKEADRKQAEKCDELLKYNQRMEEKFTFLKRYNQRTVLVRSKEPIALTKGNSTETLDDNYDKYASMDKELNLFELNSPVRSKHQNLKEEEEIKKMLAVDSNASFLRESLLDYNSFAKSDASTRITNFKSFVSLKKFKEAAKASTAKIKDLRLASKTYQPEFQPEHKPRIMTTNKCKHFF